MHQEHPIIQKVYQAKESTLAADELIAAYMPFIQSETAKFLKRFPVEGHDDELSIAMIAFHEAIQKYSHLRGSFLAYASLLIHSRLTDYKRHESRHPKTISLEEPLSHHQDTTLEDMLQETEDPSEILARRDATQSEIQELSRQMTSFGISLTDVAENCPRQERTRSACQKAIQYAKEDPQLLDEFLRTKRLPIAKLHIGSGVERKTLERHRKYLVALLLIYTNGYEIIRNHLKQMLKGGPVL